MPASPFAPPPTASDSAVKAESDPDAEEKTWLPRKPPVHLSASEFLALWRPTHPANGIGSPQLGTLAIGSVVFAPCRVQNAAPPARGSPHAPHAPPPAYCIHYALAEVTGIQVMAGTVTVSFPFTDPGVDDEAVSLYECIPCPPACLARWLQADGGTGERSGEVEWAGDTPSPSACCSILERVLRVAPEDGPLPVNDIYTAMVSSAARDGHRRANRLSVAQQRCASRLRDLYCLSDEDNANDEDDGAGRSNDDALQIATVSGRKRVLETAGTEPTVDCTAKAAKGTPPPLKQTDTAEATATDVGAASLFTWKGVVEPCSSSPSAAGGASTQITTTVLVARYSSPLTLHVFFARVFQKVNTCMERKCRSSFTTAPPRPPLPWRRLHPPVDLPLRSPPVILSLFDSYAALRRFHVYMTVRGHVVQLQDGTDSRSTTQAPNCTTTTATRTNLVCQGRPPLPSRIPVVFGTESKVWLCMLRDDTAEEDANTDSGSAARVMADQLTRLLRAAPPIDALVTFREFEKGKSDDSVEDKVVTAEEVLLRMLPHLRSARLVCNLHDVPTLPLKPGTTATATANTQSAAASVVRVSGAIFGDRKLLVPCSPEQLTLLASVLADEPCPSPPTLSSPPPPAGQKRPRSADDALQALTPALLERIALGTFTDAAASALFDAFGDASAAVMVEPSSSPVSPSTANASPTLGAVQQVTESSLRSHSTPPTLLGTVEDVYEKWCVDPARFGEAFPVFQAVYALVADVFQNPALFRSEARQPPEQQGESVEKPLAQPTLSAASSSLPRVALVLPRGNPTHHPSLSTQQFLHTLRLFFTPWTLHEVGPVAMTASSATTTLQPATASYSPFAANTCLLWHQRGGVLLLFCDEPTTQLGALQDDADVVIACGKAAAAWVAANAAVSHHHRHPATAPAESAAVHFAVISELEVVPSVDHGTHLWLPVSLHAPSLVYPRNEEAREDALAGEPHTNGAATIRAPAWAALRWPITTAAEENRSQGQSEVLWERLLCTVGADGSPMPFTSATSPASTRPPQHQQQLQNQPSTLSASATTHPSSSSSLPGRRLRHVDVLPKTLRQAVVLWRHLGEASEKAAPVNGRVGERGMPWHMLREFVKTIALSCSTATPIRMSDVVLVRRFDSESP
ncbi:hypothetical protein ABL78_6993 [Leptomonas seymouri]|uniref:Uncharacterized protein n=1 Tax=Leptomonas seymouri TaxID=5684 RepID=A0A0N1PA25_LEPSE|nr:hypothetical protein ABL78_6993 [Leptomonas seymouri]|eukprot:KPI83962.1 hypothetical protein ABL78_6993 [Leptomonas seymouri]